MVKLFPEPTSIEWIESTAPSVAEWPNPASDQLTVHFRNVNGNKPAWVEVRDVIGKLVQARPVNGMEDGILNVTDYIDGSYIIRVVFEDGAVGVRMVQLIK